MLIVDKLLMSPVTGVLWIMKELHKHVQQEQAQESDRLTAKLSELYMLLETNQLSPEDFDAQESEILDRLDAIQAKAEAGVEDHESDEQAEDGDESEQNDADAELEASEDDDPEDESDDENQHESDEENDDEDNIPEVAAEDVDPDDIEAMLLAEIESRAKPDAKPQATAVDNSPARKD